ncbi:MAG: type II toxin-antitoxin system VapC family toxin [Anaerolineales bacterium]
MYLLDTNVWLERLLDQDKSPDVGKFLDRIPSDQIFITDFAFHSIALILCKFKRIETLKKFVEDVFVYGSVSLIHLGPEDMGKIISTIEEFSLDFDDAYQYIAADKHHLRLISFDSDYDRTKLGKKTPAEVLLSG